MYGNIFNTFLKLVISLDYLYDQLVKRLTTMTSDEAAKDELKCGICFELLVDPTTMTCGHTVWLNDGFPKVNMTLRNTLNLLFKKRLQRERIF